MLIGCALFLMRGSRPDIAFALSVLGRVVTKWKRCHDRMMDRLMRYLFHHRGKGLHFRINPKDVDTVLLSAALDADHSGAVDTPRSTSGWAVFVAGASTNALVDYAAAYAKLSRVPAIAHWLFDVVGVGVLDSFANATEPMADDVRVHLGSILANCLRQRQNQRIVLDMLRSHDPTDPDFAKQTTTTQRMLNLKDRDALKTGKDVRGLMTRLLRGGPYANPLVYLQYARLLQMLAAEPSNHRYMLQRHDVSSYVEQLAFLCAPNLNHGDTQATALAQAPGQPRRLMWRSDPMQSRKGCAPSPAA